MRVLAFCDYYDEASIGGAERVGREVYGRLTADHGIDVHVIGTVPGRSKGATGVAQTARWNEPKVSTRPGVDLTALLGVQMLVSPSLRRAAEREVALRRPDVIHVNGLHFHGSWVGARVARAHSIPCVATAHLGSLGALSGAGGVAARAFDRWCVGRVAIPAHRVLAVSQSVVDHLVDLGVPRDRLDVAMNGVDRQRFTPMPRRTDRAFLQVALIGRLIANKGTLDAVEAVAQARAAGRDIRLVVVGDGPLEARVRARAVAADLAGAITFTGRVGDVEQWLQQADISLRPSYTEGLPLAVLESLSCGTPVICSHLAGNTEVVRHMHNGLVVEPGDVTALTGALCRLDADRGLLAALQKAAVAGSEEFTWDTSAQAHLDALSSVSGREMTRV
jgi:glycosyltransferase involved in cell wall biosynthesis